MRCSPTSFGCSQILNLDEGIAGLVFALNYLRIKTYSSCHGHKEMDYYNYPWVAIDDEDYQRVKTLLKDYNSKRLKRWKLELNSPSKKWILRPSQESSSDNLKMEAESLAGFLWRTKRVSE